jgi:two-component system sensor histidine kinase/response regulator
LNQLLGQRINHRAATSLSGSEHLQGLRLLLAEDNPINQKLAVKLLEKNQHQVDLAQDGQEAIQLLQETQYDLVLMDMMMPVMDGLEATRQWRLHEQQHQLQLMPIIAMTANAMQGDKERCLAEGMQGYVAKPVNPEQLYEEIDRVMQQYRPEKEMTIPPPRVRGELDDLLDRADELLADAVSETPEADQMFQWEKALESLGGDANLLEMALQMFVDEYPAHIEQLKTAWENRDFNQLGAIAHTLKSLLATFGAETARNQASELERLAKNDATATNIQPVYNRLQQIMQTLLPRLQTQLQEKNT